MIFKAEGFVHTDKPAHYVYETSFNLDKDLSGLKFKFFAGGKELFFHIKDPNGILRVQHQSSLKPSTVLLHMDEMKTGIGTCPGKIEKGKWKLKVFTYAPRFSRMWGEVPFEAEVFEGLENSEIQSDNYVSWVDSNETGKGEIVLNEFEPENIDSLDEKWLSGDFHVHSTLSDGHATPSELLGEGLSKNLDFFFISDHNILTTGFPERRGITVFPSYEVTTKNGHFNAAGLRYVPEWILSKGPEPSWKDLEKLIEDFKVHGVLISINHPFLVPWQWQYDDLKISWIDSLEIVSAPYLKNIRDINEKALSMLDHFWNNGYRITGIGGSDTHAKPCLGQPVTKVYAKPGSLSSMLDGVKNHRAEIFVDLKCDFNYITEGNSLLPGTDIQNSDDVPLEFSCSLDGESDPVLLRVVENGNIVEENKAFPGEKCVIKRIWKGNSDWIRCDLRDRNNQIRGYINPLHRGEKEITIRKWGDAVDFLSR